jgi:medium-chain acyl-[acyl-carrier-protein] hydrolase
VSYADSCCPNPSLHDCCHNFEADNLADMKDHPTPSPWIVIPKRRTSPCVRVFCLPYAGGSPTVFRTWPDAFGPEVELAFVQYPGRGVRFKEPLVTRIKAAVEMLNAAIQPYLDCPFVILGHSLGALIGFELVRELRRCEQPLPRHFIACARPAPQLPPKLTTTHTLSEEPFVKEVQFRYGGIPQAILADAEMRQLFLPILRADLEMLETYSYLPEPPLPCDISVYGGIQDRAVSPQQLGDWAKQTTGKFEQQMLPGDHFFVQNTLSFQTSLAALLSTLELS